MKLVDFKFKFTFTSSYVASCYTGGFGVTVHPTSGKLFCTNVEERKIMVLNADLTPSYSFSNDLYTAPSCLAIDTKGMVYVSDIGLGVVFKFTPQGKYLATIGSKGKQAHQFSSPGYICIDSYDIMYVTDEKNAMSWCSLQRESFLVSSVVQEDQTLNLLE